MPYHRTVKGDELCAIFVHAGAGYHSVSNEKLHLSAVSDAAKIGMSVLKGGGSAVDAVEMAIRVLEDREITNAGYGSNLTLEGHVECDATMVDHLGRSGAVGAVSQVKNPISLARVILEASSKPLSLQRVPPNFIVGPGAVEFATEHGFPVLQHDYLVSPNARSRWQLWKQDLLDASEKDKGKRSVKLEAQKLMQAGREVVHRPPATLQIGQSETDHSTGNGHAQQINFASADTLSMRPTLVTKTSSPSKRQRLDGSLETRPLRGSSVGPTTDEVLTIKHNSHDMITDTVGCIAIDSSGNIAAGSSSGGIGMKHQGRCGPAALVGIGTAVIPIDPEDPEMACVATVTSGTGEHMATTSAAATAADRIYLRIKREGATLRECDENEALYSMIKTDFMKHPGVRNQPCAGALGVLAVKKTRDGIYFYFGHNTDSFVLASMHSDERRPACTMSRSKGEGSIAQGGRVARRYENPID